MSEENDWDELGDELDEQEGLRQVIEGWDYLSDEKKAILFYLLSYYAAIRPDWKKIVHYWRN